MSGGFAAGFLPTFGRALRTAFRGRKMILLVVVLAIPPLLMGAIPGEEAEARTEGLVTILIYLFLQFLAPLTGLLFGTGILLDEQSGGTLPFLFTRPVPRAAIVLGRYAAALVCGWLALGASLAATLLIASDVDVPAGFGGRAVAATLLALPAYLAFFGFLSALTRWWALLGGFLYAFGLEGVLGLIPGMLREATLLFYTRSLLGDWAAEEVTTDFVFGADGPARPLTSVVVLLAVTAVGLFLTVGIVRRREFAGRNSGRA
jgi:ABC-type transport system involved in multi-copper enzyme maturation permease subunit